MSAMQEGLEMTREWQIWTCSKCPAIVEYSEDEPIMTCTGMGWSSGPMDWDIDEANLTEGEHMPETMQLVKVREVV